MRSIAPRPSALGVFWFGIQVVWGALLGVSLQARLSELAHGHALAIYGPVAAGGAAIAAATQIAVGILSDRRRVRGSRRIEFYLAGIALAAPALVWFYLAPSLAQLVTAIGILQIGMNVAIGPYQAVIPDFVHERDLGRASSWMAALQSAGNACGALLAALVANSLAVALAIVAALVTTAVLTAAHVRKLPLLPAHTERLRVSRAFADLFVSRGLVFLGFYTLLGYLFFFVRATLGSGDTKLFTGSVILAVTASAAAGAVLAARPSDSVDRRVIAAAGGAVFVAALAAFLFSHTVASIIGSAVVAGVAWGVFLSGDWALGCQFLPRSALATAMGVWNLALLIPQVLAPLIATLVLAGLHALGSSSAPRIAFGLAAAEVLAGVLWLRRLPAVHISVDKAPSGNTP